MTRGILFSLIASASWGLVYVLEQKTLVQFSVAKFIVYQSLFMGVIALAVIFYLPYQETTLSLFDWKVIFRPTFLILMAATFVAEFFVLNSVQVIGAAWATMFEVSYPLFTVFFAYYLLKQPLHWLTLVGAILIICGSGIVIYSNNLFK